MSSESCHPYLTRSLELTGLNQLWRASGHGPQALESFKQPMSNLAQALLALLGWPNTQQTEFHLVPQSKHSEHTLESLFKETSSGKKLATLTLNHSRTNPMDEGLGLSLEVEKFGPGDSRFTLSTGGWCAMPQKLEVTARNVTDDLLDLVLELAFEKFQGES